MLKQPKELQFKLTAILLAEVPVNPRYVTELTITDVS